MTLWAKISKPRWCRVTGDIQVNTFTEGWQAYASIAALEDGGFVVTWTSDGQDGSLSDVHAQRFDSAGIAIGSEFQVNTTEYGNQGYSTSIAALADGGFIITWSSWGQDGSAHGIFAQRYDSDGVAVGSEFQVNTFTVGSQWYSSVAALEDGGFVVTWTSREQDYFGGIYAQRYDNAGAAVGSEVQVNVANRHQSKSSVAALADGGFIIVWEAGRSSGLKRRYLCATL